MFWIGGNRELADRRQKRKSGGPIASTAIGRAAASGAGPSAATTGSTAAALDTKTAPASAQSTPPVLSFSASVDGVSTGGDEPILSPTSVADVNNGCDGIVLDVILCGAPVTASHDAWARIRPLVAGRLINVYSSRSDWALKFVYRTVEMALTVAGLQAIDVPGVESYDATDIVSGHGGYPNAIPDILKLVDFQP